jgi:hypothetical protein
MIIILSKYFNFALIKLHQTINLRNNLRILKFIKELSQSYTDLPAGRQGSTEDHREEITKSDHHKILFARSFCKTFQSRLHQTDP